MVHHLGSRIVQYQLIPAQRGLSARNMQTPVRMFAVQIRVRIDHLRLDPEAELHPQGFHLFGQSGDSPRQQLFRRHPVSETGVIISSGAEPAVIQYKQLHAAFFGFCSDLQKLLFVKIKIGGFPVIDQDRTFFFFPEAPHQPFSVESVINLTQPVQSLICIYHDSFRRLERVSGIQFPGEPCRIDPRHDPCHTVRIHLRTDPEIPAVNERDADGFSGSLIRIRPFQDDKRILLMRGVAPDALDLGSPCLQPPHYGVPFSGPRTGKLDPFVFAVRQIKAKAHGSGYLDRCIALINDPRRPGNDPFTAEQSVQQFKTDTAGRVFQRDDQRLCFFILLRISCRKTAQLRFSGKDLVAAVTEAAQTASVLLKDLDGSLSEISVSERRVFLFDMFRGDSVCSILRICTVGPDRSFQKIAEILLVVDPFSIIKLRKLSAFQHAHYIADLFVLQMKCLCFFMIINKHAILLLRDINSSK